MIIRYFSIVFILLLFISCGTTSYRFDLNKDDEPILDSNLYTLNLKPAESNFKIIDTLSYYIETFEGLDSNEGQRANPTILKFHKDGYYKKNSYLYFGRFDRERNKNSAYYGGKYSLESNTIFVESFYPSRGSKTNKYSKVISKGLVKNDTIIISFFGTTHKYVKKKYSEIFK